MITAEQISELSAELKVYDVDQGAWEHETKGLGFNLLHICSELGRNLTDRKDLTNPDVVKSEIAPDSMQYAFRLGRYTHGGAELMMPTTQDKNQVRKIANVYPATPLHRVAIIQCVAVLLSNVHDHHHPEIENAAIAREPEVAREVGRLLLYSVDLQAEMYDFDLVDAFNNRLSNLRVKHNKPEPA